MANSLQKGGFDTTDPYHPNNYDNETYCIQRKYLHYLVTEGQRPIDPRLLSAVKKRPKQWVVGQRDIS
jgi:hypothetical protein